MAEVKACASDEVWEGEMRGLVVAGRKLVVLRLDGAPHAYEDRCAHLGVPISEGKLADGVLICSAHCYEYDARTGAGINPRSACLRAVPVAEHDGAIFVTERA